MFRCSIAAANTDKLQFKIKFYSYVCGIVWMIKMITKKGGPHLNICLGDPESLVTPLALRRLFHVCVGHSSCCDDYYDDDDDDGAAAAAAVYTADMLE